MAITDDREEIVTYQLYSYQETSEAPAPHLWKKVLVKFAAMHSITDSEILYWRGKA